MHTLRWLRSCRRLTQEKVPTTDDHLMTDPNARPCPVLGILQWNPVHAKPRSVECKQGETHVTKSHKKSLVHESGNTLCLRRLISPVNSKHCQALRYSATFTMTFHSFTSTRSNPRHFVPQEDQMGDFLAAREARMAIIILTPSWLFTEVTFDNSGFSSEGHTEHDYCSIKGTSYLSSSNNANDKKKKKKKKKNTRECYPQFNKQLTHNVHINEGSNLCARYTPHPPTHKRASPCTHTHTQHAHAHTHCTDWQWWSQCCLTEIYVAEKCVEFEKEERYECLMF